LTEIEYNVPDTESGMNDHLAKPIDEKTVIEKIMYWIGKGK